MVNVSNFRRFCFQQTRIEETLRLLKGFVAASREGLTKERYLEACEATGSEPIEEEIPIGEEELTEDCIEILTLYRNLPSKVDSFSGTYVGKDFTLLEFLFRMYKVPEDLQTLYFEYLNIIDSDNVEYYLKKKKAENGKERNKNPNS